MVVEYLLATSRLPLLYYLTFSFLIEVVSRQLTRYRQVTCFIDWILYKPYRHINNDEKFWSSCSCRCNL